MILSLNMETQKKDMLSPQSEPSVERRNDMQYEVIIAEDEELILNNLIQK